MCNCGKKRTEYSSSANTGNVHVKKENPAQTPSQIRFEYIGKTALTVIGNVTRKHYHFDYPGDKQNIHYRDIQGVMTIPVLKKVDE
jgi:hypothetical protein